MLDKLLSIKNHFEDVERQLSDPKTLADMKVFAKLNKEYKELQTIVEAYHKYKSAVDDVEGAKEILRKEKDPDLISMAKSEIDELTPKISQMEEHIRQLLIPKDPEDEKNAVLEIRAGTGGDEASIFAGDLYRMYMRYCEKKGLKFETV
ncbi:MAG TPA: PCRF domain-containing protein, partial [Bacteroidia bacterium]